jgi:hypothetical protein|tara:strand:+ start:194 stop:514 length:321 start_codon:yes stop_codon:yes gene_type:complete
MDNSSSERPYKKWSFVEKDLDQDQWYIRLDGGKYHGVVFNYTSIKMITEDETLTFDYEIRDYYDDDPHGKPEFNAVVGEILKYVLEDAIDKKDFVIGEKDDKKIIS